MPLMNKDYLAVIPARGGSKGLPGKNLRKVQGLSLVARAVLLARQVSGIKWIIVSTDDPKIAGEARFVGGEVPFLRPRELARSETPMTDVLEHAYSWFKKHVAIDAVNGLILLQPTSPMRKLEHINGAIDLYEHYQKTMGNVASVSSVSPVPDRFRPEFHWQPSRRPVRGRKNRCINPMVRSAAPSVVPVYYRNGAVIILDPDRLQALTLNESPVSPYIIDEPLVSIDSLHDLLSAEYCGRRLEPDPSTMHDHPAREMSRTHGR